MSVRSVRREVRERCAPPDRTAGASLSSVAKNSNGMRTALRMTHGPHSGPNGPPGFTFAYGPCRARELTCDCPTPNWPKVVLNLN